MHLNHVSLKTQFSSNASQFQPTRATRRSVLISGASIAGTTLAYWLRRYGFAVTVVEKSASIRLGGYPIDVRGNAIEVAKRMGLGAALQQAHIRTRAITFVDDRTGHRLSLRPELLVGSSAGTDVELPRGKLTSLIYEQSREHVEYRFNTSISRIDDGANQMNVTFSDGSSDVFDIVLGADGLHSNTRTLAFGPEEQFDHTIGRCFVGFEIPNTLGISYEGLLANRPGMFAALYAPADAEQLHVFFTFPHPRITRAQQHDVKFQRELVREAFGDWGWLVPHLLTCLEQTDALFFDEVKQIRMSSFAKGRVALVGDAAYAPSFLTGQGTSLAMVGAYVLACELAQHANHSDAFAAYERVIRPFVLANQARLEEGGSSLIPVTQAALDARNRMLAELKEAPPASGRPEHDMLDLSVYAESGL